MKTSELNLYQKIIRVYEQVSTVVKYDHISVGNNSYSAVSHDAVVKALHGPLAQHGIVVIPSMLEAKIERYEKEKTYNGQTTKQEWFRADCHVCVKFVNADKPEENFVTGVWSYALDTSDKAMGKAYTYAIKMIYLKVFLLESADQEEQRIYEQEAPRPQTKTYNESRAPEPSPVKPKPALVNYAPQSNGAKTDYDGPISDKQVKRMFAIAYKNNWTAQDITANILKNYGVAPENLTAKKYEEAVSFFEANESIPF